MVLRFIGFIKINLYFWNLCKNKLHVREKRRWKKAFLNFIYKINKNDSDFETRWNIIKGFAKNNITIIKQTQNSKKNIDPILICIMLNEIERINVFLEHYRKMGIRKFAILDNGSTDGTADYLKQQYDVDLFQTKDKFESKIKVGWINRIISYYGTSHWYLVVDADELLVWQGVEEGKIQNMVELLNKKGIMRARALMVDMYPKEIKWNTKASFEDVFPECQYFDSDTYYHHKTEELYLICGGPRGRKLGVEAWLTKYPLFKLKEKEFVCNPHVIYPYENKKTPCYFAILHYKFLTQNDRKRIRKYAKLGNYACNSAEYKLYLRRQRENAANFNFYHEKSVLYKSSQSLESIKHIDSISQKVNRAMENNNCG